jgi:hypothetical protein
MVEFIQGMAIIMVADLLLIQSARSSIREVPLERVQTSITCGAPIPDLSL